jgi:hypothetical protein
MKFCEKYEVEMLKIIIGYTLNNFSTHITIFIVHDGNIIISKLKYKLEKIKNIHFVDVETDP